MSKAQQRVNAYLSDQEKIRESRIEQDLRRALLRGALSLGDITERFKITRRKAEAMLRQFRQAGANLVERDGRWSIDREMAPPTEAAWRMVSNAAGVHRFGLIADTHYGSKHCRHEVVEELYDWFAANGIRTVFHCGNWIEGEARFNKHELVDGAHGMQQQIDLFVELYPQRPGIETRYVAGDDHEGWYSQREGVEIGRLLQSTAREAGRTDLIYLGYKEAFVTLEHQKTKKHARLLVDHPGGGSSYAVSYAAQKRIEAAQGGEKPAIWAFGHWHKAGYFINRGVHAILVPCTKDLDTFGRKKGLEYVVGGVIVEAHQDEGGAITGVVPQFKLFYDRGYHNQQYSLSGPVRRREAR